MNFVLKYRCSEQTNGQIRSIILTQLLVQETINPNNYRSVHVLYCQLWNKHVLVFSTYTVFGFGAWIMIFKQSLQGSDQWLIWCAIFPMAMIKGVTETNLLSFFFPDESVDFLWVLKVFFQWLTILLLLSIVPKLWATEKKYLSTHRKIHGSMRNKKGY